jgi:hypothetical protein
METCFYLGNKRSPINAPDIAINAKPTPDIKAIMSLASTLIHASTPTDSINEMDLLLLLETIHLLIVPIPTLDYNIMHPPNHTKTPINHALSTNHREVLTNCALTTEGPSHHPMVDECLIIPIMAPRLPPSMPTTISNTAFNQH